jgi:hypothetical protein
MPRSQSRLRPTRVSGALVLLSVVATVRLMTGGVQAQTASASSGGTAAAIRDAIPSDPDHVVPYKLPFGPNPYLPSQATTDFSGFLKPSDIPSASYCAHCHAGVHAQWRQSAHANSFRTPWYVENVNELATTKGVAYTRHCSAAKR